MKILIVHNSYKLKGGEDTVFSSEQEILAMGGQVVSSLVISNHIVEGVFQKIKVLLHVTHSRKSQRKLAHSLATHHPSIVHVHNFFPLLTPGPAHEIFCNSGGLRVARQRQEGKNTCSIIQDLRSKKYRIIYLILHRKFDYSEEDYGKSIPSDCGALCQLGRSKDGGKKQTFVH